MVGAEQLHIPVMRDACLDLLAPALAGPALLIDCTLGMGGHTEAALQRFPELRVIGIDRDPEALALAGERLAPFGDRFTAVKSGFESIADIAPEAPRGILMDLGVSSLQLDDAGRGFAYAQDGPVDMRMDPTSGIPAAAFLGSASHGEIARVISTYGEERFAGKIASAIVRHPRRGELTTGELAELVREAIPAPARRTGGHPAKRTFQALRIHVNDELGQLERGLAGALDVLALGGRIVVESYHSLEDRIVKRTLAAHATTSTPLDLPVQAEEPPLRLLTRGALKAPEDEVRANPRSASVRVRAAEKRTEGPIS
ncbi:MAG: 16S rRNA (cytosine(1402)-N(4))-methyltransferase RsmH [Flaviflexus sp.]|nr:16S rRNA (cytosine(1402)-N(4))-methyltransferase RsmH [Flaviflexus sp.]